MNCTRCREKAELALRSHNAAFCRACFLVYFQRQVEKTIRRDNMFTHDDRVLVAVSGGKDSLALWDVLIGQGYHTEGLYLALGIGKYSAQSQEKTEAFAKQRQVNLRVVQLEQEAVTVPFAAQFTRRMPCAACGTMKRHYFDQAAYGGGFNVLATGHNLDDEAARLLSNVMHWESEYLARQKPVLEPSHPKFVRKVRPLYKQSELETAAYTFFRGIDHIIEECPNSEGASQLFYKEMINRMETKMPGTKRNFVQKFMRSAQPLFDSFENNSPPRECEQCGMPSFAPVCAFCNLVSEVDRKSQQVRETRRNVHSLATPPSGSR